MKRVSLDCRCDTPKSCRCHVNASGSPRYSPGYISEPASTIPTGINGFLQHHGINAGAMFAKRQRFSVEQIDRHLAGRNLKPADRAAVKSSLTQIGLLE